MPPSLLLTADLERSLQRVAELAVAHVGGCDQVGISLPAGDRLETGVWVGDDVGAVDGAQYDSGDGPCLEAAWNGRVEHVPDLDEEPRWPAFTAVALEHGIRCSLSYPLSADGETLGALNLYGCRPHAFDDAAQRTGLVLAETAVVALTNARAYGLAKSAVVALQRALLPRRLPEPESFELAARYLPASQAALVGGDWYDALDLPGGGICLTIGDVAGHGLAAATTMGELRGGLRAYALEGHGPAAVLGLVRGLCEDFVAETFATVCKLVVHPPRADGVPVCVASAGHPPPLLVPPGGPPRLLDLSPNPPLGVPTTEPDEDHEVTIPHGSVLLLFTDGLVERRGQAIDHGLDRLTRLLEDPPADLEALCDTTLTALDASASEDDVALLAVRV